jgi:hypothetical protein
MTTLEYNARDASIADLDRWLSTRPSGVVSGPLGDSVRRVRRHLIDGHALSAGDVDVVMRARRNVAADDAGLHADAFAVSHKALSAPENK